MFAFLWSLVQESLSVPASLPPCLPPAPVTAADYPPILLLLPLLSSPDFTLRHRILIPDPLSFLSFLTSSFRFFSRRESIHIDPLSLLPCSD